MKKWGLFILILIVLTGCRSTPFNGHAVIDWVDFIKWEDIEYNGIYSGVLTDEKYIGEKLGTVKFRVADNVTNPNYKIRNGDAAYHEKGTEIFRIKGMLNLIAVKDASQINGYRVYYARDATEQQWHFKNVPLDKVNKIEFYQPYTSEGNKLLNTYTNLEELRHILELLENSEESPNFSPNTEKGDPDFFQIVLYTDEPIAYKYDVQFDGSTFYWYPWDTAILSNEIQTFLKEK
jgi:phage pi2 protein 07